MRLPGYLPYICGDTLTAFTLSRGLFRPSEEKDGLYNALPDILAAIRVRWPRVSHVMIYATGGLSSDEANTYLGVQGRQAAYTIPKVIFAFFVILHITFDSLVYIHANIRKLTQITYIPAYGN